MSIKLLLIAGLAFIAGLVVFSLLSFDSGSARFTRLITQTGCNLSTDPVCTAVDQSGHKVSVSLSPRPVPILKDVQILSTLDNFAAETIRTARIHIEGLNMYMGIQIIPLQITRKTANESQLTGTLKLPICTSRVMEWQATVVLQTADKEYHAAFPFTTIAP